MNTLVLDAVSKSRGAGRREVPALRGVSLQRASGEIALIIEDEYAPLIDALQQSDERPGVVSLESSILPGG